MPSSCEMEIEKTITTKYDKGDVELKGFWDKPYFGRVLHFIPKTRKRYNDKPICGIELVSVFTGHDQEIHNEPKCKKCTKLVSQQIRATVSTT